jgi:hypothetical protein
VKLHLASVAAATLRSPSLNPLPKIYGRKVNRSETGTTILRNPCTCEAELNESIGLRLLPLPPLCNQLSYLLPKLVYIPEEQTLSLYGSMLTSGCISLVRCRLRLLSPSWLATNQI